jgi:acetoin utilization protein AcuB
MYVVQHMSSPPVTVKPDVPIATARETLQSHHFRHLPVVDEDGRLMGMVTDRDLRSAYPSSMLDDSERQAALEQLARTPVSEIMTPEPVELIPGSTLDDALFLFDRHKVGALPVIDDQGRLTGVFSIRDLMKAYKELFGLGERGSALVEVEDDGQPQILTRIVQALESGSIPFTRLVRTASGESGTAKGPIYVRVHTYNVHGVHDILREAGLRITAPTAQPG